MLIVWLIALPGIMAVVLLAVRRIRIVAAPLSAATLLATAILAATRTDTVPLSFLGRTISLSSLHASAVACCCLLLGLMMIYAYRIDQGALTYPATLACMALSIGAIAMQNATLATLLLAAAAALAIILIPNNWPGSALTGMHALAAILIACPLLLLGAWAIESRIVSTDQATLSRFAELSLALGYAIILGVAPLGLWLPPIFRRGSPISAAILSVVLSMVALLQLSNTFRFSLWPEGQQFFLEMAVTAGALTAILGGLVAFTQRSLSGALGYAAIADLGIVLLGLGLEQSTGNTAAILHLAYRGIAVVVVSMGLGILRQCLHDDDTRHLQGAFQRAPLTMLAITIAGSSLAGLPLTAGFTTRLAILRLLGGAQLNWILAIGLSGLGPAWAVVRGLVIAFGPARTEDSKREAFVPALLTLLLACVLLVLGLFPALLAQLPASWLASLPSTTLSVSTP